MANAYESQSSLRLPKNSFWRSGAPGRPAGATRAAGTNRLRRRSSSFGRLRLGQRRKSAPAIVLGGIAFLLIMAGARDGEMGQGPGLAEGVAPRPRHLKGAGPPGPASSFFSGLPARWAAMGPPVRFLTFTGGRDARPVRPKRGRSTNDDPQAFPSQRESLLGSSAPLATRPSWRLPHRASRLRRRGRPRESRPDTSGPHRTRRSPRRCPSSSPVLAAQGRKACAGWPWPTSYQKPAWPSLAAGRQRSRETRSTRLWPVPIHPGRGRTVNVGTAFKTGATGRPIGGPRFSFRRQALLLLTAVRARGGDSRSRGLARRLAALPG